jgi:Big-like domain-containing protein
MTTWNGCRSAAAWVAALLWVTISVGCTTQEPGSNTGSAEVRVTLPQALSAADVKRVRVEVQGPGISPPITAELVQVGTTWQGTVSSIPAGPERVISAFASDASGVVLFQGSAASLTVSAGSTVSAFLLLQQVNTPPPFYNEAPQISSIVLSSNTVTPGGTLYLSASAYDPNGDALSFSWTAAAGSFSTPTSEWTSWTAPSTEGTHRLRLEVTDARGTSTSVSFDVYVLSDGVSGSVDVTVGFNTWPEIRAMQGTPAVLGLGTVTRLSATVVDADGDTLTHAWFTDCNGTFDDAGAASPSFTLTVMPPSGRCFFQLTVWDPNGGVHSGTLALQAGSTPRVNVMPRIDSTWQSLSSARGGELVTLSLNAHDPDGAFVSFSWSSSAGEVQTTTWTSTSSQATWLAPSCLDSPAYIYAAVTDADGASLTYGFTVLPVPGSDCSALAVNGIRNIYNIPGDGPLIPTPADLSTTTIGAYVPTADGSGFVYVAGMGRPDGTFTIPGVERTPYYLRIGSTSFWTSSRFVDLSAASLGRPDVEQEPAGTELAFQLDGLTPWQSTDDLQLHATGPGIGFVSTSCATGFPFPAEGATTLTGSMDYGNAMRGCGTVPARFDSSRGDFFQVTQHVSRVDSSTLPTGLVLTELRKGFQAHDLSGPTDGGTVDAGMASEGTLMVKGTLLSMPTTTQSFDFRASEFETLALAAHSGATLVQEGVNMGTLPSYLDFGQYDGYPDLANATNENPGQGNFAVVFEYGNPYPGFWPKVVMAQASAAAPFSVDLADGGTSRPIWYSTSVFSQSPVWEGSTQPLIPMVGPPRDLRVNGVPASGGSPTVSAVGTSPTLTWAGPAIGAATRYQARLYEIYATSTGGTARTLLGYYTTTDTQLRLPNLVAGKTYFVILFAYSIPGTSLDKPYQYGPEYHYASVFSAKFSP